MGNCNSRSEDEEDSPKANASPKTSVNPYIWFYLDVCRELAPKSIKEIASEAGKRWRSMTYAEREPYVKIALQKKDSQHGSVKNRGKPVKARTERSKLRSSTGHDKRVKFSRKLTKKK